MTLSVIASSAQGAINGGSITFTIPTTNAGDIVIVGSAITSAVTGTVTSSNGTAYTQICPTVANGNLNLAVWARQCAASETTASASGSGTATDGDSFCYTVIRGAPFTFIKASSGATGTSANPNSPGLSVGSTSALSLSIAASLTATTITTLPTGYSSGANANASDTRSSTISVATVIQSEQGTEDPAAWTYAASAAWVAFTVAFASSDSVYFSLPPVGSDFSRTTEITGY